MLLPTSVAVLSLLLLPPPVRGTRCWTGTSLVRPNLKVNQLSSADCGAGAKCFSLRCDYPVGHEIGFGCERDMDSHKTQCTARGGTPNAPDVLSGGTTSILVVENETNGADLNRGMASAGAEALLTLMLVASLAHLALLEGKRA